MDNLNINKPDDDFFTNISQNQLKKTNVYSTREDFLLENLKQKSRIIEIGTLAGDFAYHILTEYDPEYLLLVDLFDQPDHGVYINEPAPKERFTRKNNKDWVVDRFKEYKNVEIKISKGFVELANLHKTLLKNPSNNNLFDFIYLDSNHSFSNVMRELLAAEPLIKVGGIIGINDYMINGIFTKEIFDNARWQDISYGTMKASSIFLDKFSNWRVMSIALNGAGNMDLFLQKESEFIN